MSGSIGGNLIGTLYFAIYQVCGILMAFTLFKKEKKEVRILIGSIIGNITLMWFPIICSFFAQFTIGSHVAGVILEIALTLFVVYYIGRMPGKADVWGAGSKKKSDIRSGYKNSQKAAKQKASQKAKQKSARTGNEARNSAGKAKGINADGAKAGSRTKYFKEYPVLFLAIPLLIYFFILLWNHVLMPQSDGGVYTGQATFGDMNMHLGFITSIARQHMFPPIYSIFPDAKLSYPFLSDTISSSVYIWGSSLRFAYILPMVFAVIHVFAGMYALAAAFLKNKWKAFLAFVLFFLNGGLGFIYFFNGTYSLNEMMTAFYKTPANLVDEGVKWTNIIVDMLLPQRATLFGWSVLFTTLFIIYKARETADKQYYIIASIMAGSLPMIHTHSFLALGIICFGWLIMDLTKTCTTFGNTWDDDKTKPLTKIIIGTGIAVIFVIMTVLTNIKKTRMIPSGTCMGITVLGLILIFCAGMYIFFKNINKEKTGVFKLYMIFLGIVLILALPQLLIWTFNQVGNAGVEMLRGHFNWTNDGDVLAPYVIFFFKNLGIMGVLIVASLILSGKKNLAFIFPAAIIWFISQFVLFQPNPYDNNKLLLVSYMMMCIIAADVTVNLLKRIPKTAMYAAAAIIIIISSASALMTMAREVYSGMPGVNIGLYGKDELEAAEFIEENIDPEATFLTDTNNDNLVAAITGRNIVCGSPSYLYYHGFSTGERENDIQQMYSYPDESSSLFSKYGVDFIFVGNAEYIDFENMNQKENYIYSKYPCIFSNERVRIYQAVEKNQTEQPE